MQVRVLVFGQLTEATGEDEFTLNDVRDTDALQQAMAQRYPLLQHKKFLIAVNKQPVAANTILNDGYTVALLPPFSGG